MTEAHLTIYGPDPTLANPDPAIPVACLYTATGASAPEQVLPAFDAALNATPTGLYGVEGFIWQIVPSPVSLADNQGWAFTQFDTDSVGDGWVYTVTVDDNRCSVSVRPSGDDDRLPVLLHLNTPGGLLANYEAAAR